MDLRQLAAVVAVAETGSFSAAADELHVSQPALSQQVKTLENELGAALFRRLPRGARLTAAGAALLGPAREAGRAAATARARVAAVVGVKAGRLDLVSLPTLAVDPVAELIGAFRRAHSGVGVHLDEPDDTAALADMVLDGRSEIGITDGASVPPSLVSRSLGSQEFHLVSPPRADGAPTRRRTRPATALADLAFVTTPPGTSTRDALERAFAAVGATPRIAVETSQREALLPLVLAGSGSTLLPQAMADDARRRGAVVAALTPAIRRDVVIVHRDAPLAPAAAAFVRLAPAGR